ncbi:MAG: LemA family protein, partial [Bdellovibrionales bacterium]|nr:LemA family protein [Bdellovibrionales bacterium]
YYNGTVRDFNVMVQSFPSNLIANMMKYQSRKFFELEYVTERKTPDVDFR